MIVDTGLSENDINRIQEIFASHKSIEKVILLGSRAMGTYKPASDIDLTLIGKHIDLTQINEIENQLDDLLLPYRFDLSVFEQIDDADFKDHINRVGKEFYISND